MPVPVQAARAADPRSLEQLLVQCFIDPSAAAEFREVLLPFMLKPHQIANLHAGLAWDRFGLFDEARTGKTVVMQLLAIVYRHYGRRTIVVCPPILFAQFKRELERIEGHDLRVDWLRVTGARARTKLEEWALGVTSPPDILLITRAMLAGPYGKDRRGPPTIELLARCYHHIIWDECHLGLQDEQTKVLAAMEWFMANVPHARLVLATGTPITTELQACYPIIRLKTPEAYSSRRHFDSLHVRYVQRFVRCPPSSRYPDGSRPIPVIAGYDNQALLTRNLFLQARRVLRRDVLSMHDPNLQVLTLQLDPAHLRFYKQVLRDRLVEIVTTAGSEVISLAQAQALRMFALRIITNPRYGGFDKPVPNVIVETCRMLFQGLGPDGKLVIFANFNSSVEFLAAQFRDVNAVTVYGRNDPATNRRHIEQFCSLPTHRVAVINPQAGGVGFTLGHVCATAVFAEPVSSPALFEQAACRVVLEGQTDPAAIYLLDVQQTFTQAALKRMQAKATEINDVTLDSKTLVGELMPH